MPRRCEKGFVQTHLEYTIHQQSPACFHIWVALGVVSAVLGRKVWMPSSGSQTEAGYYNLYPNLYIVLVSPSGVGMKGTSLSQGINLLDKSEVPINILRGKITPTRLITRLNSGSLMSSTGAAELMIFSREFKVFTKGIIKDSSLLEDLTDLYDCTPFDYETEHSVQQTIKSPCIQILAASTPEWLSGGNAGDVMSGGFGARVLPVAVIRDEKQIAWPGKTHIETELEEKLITDLQTISKLEGQFYVTQAARDYFEGWYMQRLKLRTYLDSRLDGYYSKKHDQIRKLSMVLSAAVSSDMTVDVLHMKTAMALLEENEKTLLFAYSGAAANVEMKYRDQVLAKIKEKGQVSHTELAQYFYHGLGRKGLKEVVFGLLEEKAIEAETVETKTKPKLVYKYLGEVEE